MRSDDKSTSRTIVGIAIRMCQDKVWKGYRDFSRRDSAVDFWRLQRLIRERDQGPSHCNPIAVRFKKQSWKDNRFSDTSEGDIVHGEQRVFEEYVTIVSGFHFGTFTRSSFESQKTSPVWCRRDGRWWRSTLQKWNDWDETTVSSSSTDDNTKKSMNVKLQKTTFIDNRVRCRTESDGEQLQLTDSTISESKKRLSISGETSKSSDTVQLLESRVRDDANGMTKSDPVIRI